MTAIKRTAVLALVDERDLVMSARAYAADDQEDYQRAVAFVTDGIRPTDRIVKYLNGERVRLGLPAPSGS